MGSKSETDDFGLPFLNVTINNGEMLEKAKVVVCQMRREWSEEDVVCKLLTDGFTNNLAACRLSSDHTGQDVLLVRVYGDGTDVLIDRAREKLTMITLHRLHCGAQLFGSFENGLVYGFVRGSTLDQKMLYDFKIQRLLAKELVNFHTVDVEQAQKNFHCQKLFNKEPSLFITLRKWINYVPSDFQLDKGCWKKETLASEVELLEQELSSCGSPVVFCHNDLLPNNIIYDEEKKKVSFIDFEYSQPNYQAFDIATFFSEFVGMKEIDFSLYPTKDYQTKWLRMYCESQGKSKEEEVTDVMVERMYVQVNKFALVSHLYWAIWGIAQSKMSTIDFDYLKFSQQRLEEYNRRKTEFLNLRLP